jgi:hypothetical protein
VEFILGRCIPSVHGCASPAEIQHLTCRYMKQRRVPRRRSGTLRRGRMQDRLGIVQLSLSTMVYGAIEPVCDGIDRGMKRSELENAAATTRSPRTVLLVSLPQSIDYPHQCKFAFQSVLANALEQLNSLQSLSSTNPRQSPCFRTWGLYHNRRHVWYS